MKGFYSREKRKQFDDRLKKEQEKYEEEKKNSRVIKRKISVKTKDISENRHSKVLEAQNRLKELQKQEKERYMIRDNGDRYIQILRQQRFTRKDSNDRNLCALDLNIQVQSKIPRPTFDRKLAKIPEEAVPSKIPKILRPIEKEMHENLPWKKGELLDSLDLSCTNMKKLFMNRPKLCNSPGNMSEDKAEWLKENFRESINEWAPKKIEALPTIKPTKRVINRKVLNVQEEVKEVIKISDEFQGKAVEKQEEKQEKQQILNNNAERVREKKDEKVEITERKPISGNKAVKVIEKQEESAKILEKHQMLGNKALKMIENQGTKEKTCVKQQMLSNKAEIIIEKQEERVELAEKRQIFCNKAVKFIENQEENSDTSEIRPSLNIKSAKPTEAQEAKVEISAKSPLPINPSTKPIKPHPEPLPISAKNPVSFNLPEQNLDSPKLKEPAPKQKSKFVNKIKAIPDRADDFLDTELNCVMEEEAKLQASLARLDLKSLRMKYQSKVNELDHKLFES